MNISSGKVSIRNIIQSDMDFIQSFWGDEESMLASGGAYMIREEDKEDLFNILNKGDDLNNHYMILVEGELIGDLSLRNFDEKKAQMDMKILNDKRNNGYGKLALSMFLDFYFNQVGGEEIFFELWLVNYFANKKLKDYGFEATQVMEDANIMTLTKESYQQSVLLK